MRRGTRHSKKHTFPSFADADAWLNDPPNLGQRSHMRIYKCDECDGWHLATKRRSATRKLAGE